MCPLLLIAFFLDYDLVNAHLECNTILSFQTKKELSFFSYNEPFDLVRLQLNTPTTTTTTSSSSFLTNVQPRQLTRFLFLRLLPTFYPTNQVFFLSLMKAANGRKEYGRELLSRKCIFFSLFPKTGIV